VFKKSLSLDRQRKLEFLQLTYGFKKLASKILKVPVLLACPTENLSAK